MLYCVAIIIISTVLRPSANFNFIANFSYSEMARLRNSVGAGAVGDDAQTWKVGVQACLIYDGFRLSWRMKLEGLLLLF